MTTSYAQRDFGMNWSELKAIMQEIEDAGHWRIKQNGIPEFDPNRVPPRPVPTWAEPEPGPAPEPEDPSASLTHAALAQGGGACGSLKLKPSKDTRIPFGDTSAAEPAAVRMPIKTRLWVSRSYGKETSDLVEFFSVKIRTKHFGQAPGGENLNALGSHIKRWLREGMSHAEIKAMIDIFTSEPGYLKQRSPAWKSFVMNRQKLLVIAQQRKQRNINSQWTRKG